MQSPSLAGSATSRRNYEARRGNHRARNIRLNTELVKKPKDLLEYVVLHEMINLIESKHSERIL